MISTPRLETEDVRLVPFSEPWHMEYLWSLICRYKYNTVTEKKLFEEVSDRMKYIWLGRTKDAILGGVIYLSYVPEAKLWSLDAYRDDKLLRTIKDQKYWSYEAGKLVCDFFFSNKICDSLYTMHIAENVLATRLCQKLGFKKFKEIELDNKKYIMLRRRHHGN